MQANHINEQGLVKQCMAELCNKAGLAGSTNLVQRDLEFLCDSIESKTGVMISLSTIRRLLNGQFSRLPQSATLNAICTYLGYQNWQDFKQSKNVELTPAVSSTTVKEEPVHTPAHPIRPRSYRKALLLSSLFVFAALSLFAMLKLTKSKPGNFNKATLSATKTTSNDLPNTVVFSYNIDDVHADSFFLQQSWDRTRRVRIYKNNYTLTDIYYEPGYHVAKLIANDQVIKTIDVSIPTDRWFFYAKEKLEGSIPQYISSSQPFKNGSLKLDKEEVAASQVDTEKEQVYIHVYFPSAIEHSSDNFRMKFRARVNEVIPVFCPYLMCEIFTQRNFTFFKTTSKGCTSEIMAQFGDHFLNGKTYDFSAMGTDVKDWQNGEVVVKDKQVSIRINNKGVFSTKYEQSSGLITGLGFISNGLCEIDFVSLESLEGKKIYSNEF